MKKMSSITCIVLVLCSIILFAPKKAHAVDFGIGMYSYYAWWSPSFRNQYESFELEPMILYGPVLSISFMDKWSISFLVVQNLLVGKEMAPEGNITYRSSGTFGAYQVEDTRRMYRFDADLTLSYSLFDQLRLFFGGKYMYCAFEGGSEEDIHLTGAYTLANDGSLSEDWGGISSWGFGTGISLNLPIIGGLSIQVNESLLYSQTSFDLPVYAQKVPAAVIGMVKEENSYHGIGSNTSLALLYYISPIQTSISLGGRFQVIHYFSGSGPDMDNDYFYGLTASVIITF